MRSRTLRAPGAPIRSTVSVAILVLLALATCCATRAGAAEHVTITGEYGKEGPKATGLGDGCTLAWDGARKHLYLFSESKVFGLAVGVGEATPLGGNFPIETGINSSCGLPDIAVDPSGGGNIYATPDTSVISGWGPDGSPLGSPWPISNEGESCGLAVTGSGEVWSSDYANQLVRRYSAAGEPLGSIKVGVSPCRIAVDASTGDLYVAPYNGEAIFKLSKASGYMTKTSFAAANTGGPGLAVNGAEGKLYVGNGTATVQVFDTLTGGQVETIDLGEVGGQGIAVDEATDTLFVTVGSGSTGVIREYFGRPTPKATTGPPTGNSEVSGTADPNGLAPITECYFEFGPTTSYGSRRACDEPTPITTTETVHANLPGLVGGETYHYRLVLKNGEPNVVGRGADKTIAPTNVKGLTTEPASGVTASSAVLNASFEGTGEDTHYYFQWGQSARYNHTVPAPPGTDAGTTTGDTRVATELSGLKPGVLYHFRAVAENSIGKQVGGDLTFTTFELPSIESFTARNITAGSAQIVALINPHGFDATYFVEYGRSTSYGSIAPVPAASLGATSNAQEVTVQLSGLESAVYHFRVVAESVFGRTETNDQTFNFYPPPCPNAVLRQQTNSQYLPDCRAYELVSPPEAGGITLTTAPNAPAPFATGPTRFAFGGYLGSLPGTDPTNSIGSDYYVAARTNSGWVSHFVGVNGKQALGGSPLVPSLDLGRFFQFLENEGFEGVKQPANRIPYIWSSEGDLLERWPANFESIAGALSSEGAWQTSPDLTHLAFSSDNVNFTAGQSGEEGRVGEAPGSAYDYDSVTKTTRLISLTAAGQPIAQEPGNTASTHEFILFPGNGVDFYNNLTHEASRGDPKSLNPGVSTDGSHILMSTSSAPYEYFTKPRPPVRLYMRVNDAVTYEVSQGHAVEYVGMTADGSKVYFTSPDRLTGEDTDSSVDLYMWSEAQNKLTDVSVGSEGVGDAGNTDECTATWTSDCGVVPITGEYRTSSQITDSSIASEAGDVYFFSPEQLEGQRGVPNRENLYVYRGGRPQFVASLDPKKPGPEESGPISRIEVSPDGAHAAFISASRLTSYDNAGFEEMYSYEPSTEKLRCSSCRPDGLPPEYDATGSKAGLFLANDGRTFFNTQDPLVSQDTNQEQDVYEFVEGRPQLITSGTGTHSESIIEFGGGGGNIAEEGLTGVSANGQNVYFAAREELVPQDKNGAFLVFYDARVGGGFPYEPPLAPCEAADECHGDGSRPPASPNLASETGLGGGNALHHKKHRKHKKKHHRKSKRHRHHAKGAKGAKKSAGTRARRSTNGRAGKHHG